MQTKNTHLADFIWTFTPQDQCYFKILQPQNVLAYTQQLSTQRLQDHAQKLIISCSDKHRKQHPDAGAAVPLLHYQSAEQLFGEASQAV